MRGALRAELFAMRRRPAVKIVIGLYLVSLLLFGLGAQYVVYLVGPGPADAAGSDPEQQLAAVLPGQAVSLVLSGLPTFGVAYMVVLGAMTMGAEYRWGTLATVLTQGPSRATVMLARIGALALVLLCTVAVAVAVVVAATSVLALVEGQPVRLPPPGTLLVGLGAGWLICAGSAFFGTFLAVLFRGAGSAIGVGLVWALVVEGSVLGLTFVLPALETVQRAMLGPSASSLAAAVGARSQADGGSPFVVAVSGPGVATSVLAAYVVMFAGLAVLTAARRDVP